MSKFKELLAQYHEVKAELSANLKEAFQETVEEAFAANPLIGWVAWTQYAPWFNDGDTCTFYVHEPGAGYNWLLEDENTVSEEGWDISPHEDHSAVDEWTEWNELNVGYSDWDWVEGVKVYKTDKVSPEQLEKINEISRQEQNVIDALWEFEDFFYEMFEDHIQVHVYRDNDGKPVINVSEYSHD